MKQDWNTPFIAPEACFACPMLYRDFDADNVTKACLAITGLGLYRASLNGERIGEDYLTPGFNDYDAYLRYQTYDVTALIRRKNRIEVLLGDGWYMGRFGAEGRTHIFGDKYLLSACLCLTLSDGSTREIKTDDTWLAVRSPLVETSIYDGEVRDDTRSPGEPVPCRVLDVPYRPEPEFSSPVRCFSVLRPTLLCSENAEYILDFGQNMAGTVRFINRLPYGAAVRLQFGEVLQNGCFYRDNLRSARAEYVYTSDGVEKTIEPYFTYYGFRYVKVSGQETVDPADFSALALSSELADTLVVRTDNAKLNRLIDNVRWGLRSNFLDVPTDCPQRDERLGWTADAQVFVNTACYLTSGKAFYRKYMRDMRTDQTRYYTGNIPMYSPSLKGECGPGGAVWADAATIVPWQVYRYYGDITLLQESYPMMRDYVETLLANDAEHGGSHIIDFGFCFGDWLALDGANPLAMKGGTDDTFIRSVYYWNSVHLTALAAAELGLSDDAARYAVLADKIRTAVLDEYVTPGGRLAVDTQTGYVLALTYGIWRDHDRMREGFLERLKRDGFVLRTGFAGTPLLLPALFENGFSDIAYRMLYRETFPGWLYAVNLGATTVWERWNSLQSDGSVSEAGMNSLNHYAYGSVLGAICAYMAGLRCGTAGWKTAVIAPQLNGRMKHMELSFDSPAGKYRVQWEIRPDETFFLAVTVPEGAAAELLLPDHPDAANYCLTPGEHTFHYCPTVPYLYPFSCDTPACDLLENAEAADILNRQMPQLYGFLCAPDCSLTSHSLRELADILPFVKNDDVMRTGALLANVGI